MTLTLEFHTIPASTCLLHRLELGAVDRLDESGEACRYCQAVDREVQVQAYTTSVDGEPVMVSCCCDCLAWALSLADADLLEPVVVEFETTNPVAVAL